MRGRVKLPPGDVIDIYDLCSAIAQALCPTDQLEDIDCIVGGLIRVPAALAGDRLSIPPDVAKMVEATLAAASSTPSATAESDFTKREFPCQPLPSGTGAVELPIVLTDDDRRWLEEILPKLPRLCHPISDKEAEMFLTAYRGLPDRRAWEPSLITAVGFSRRKMEHDNVFMLHRSVIERMFEGGQLIAFDRQHCPISVLTVRSLISRSTAIAYLQRNGLAEFNEHQLSPEERKKAIVAYWTQQEKIGVKNPTQLTEKKFKVSDSYVRKCLREADPDRAAKKTSPSSVFPKPKRN